MTKEKLRKRRLEQLMRRAHYLAIRIRQQGRTNSFDVAEKAALDWAIAVLNVVVASPEIDEVEATAANNNALIAREENHGA